LKEIASFIFTSKTPRKESLKREVSKIHTCEFSGVKEVKERNVIKFREKKTKLTSSGCLSALPPTY
jgi:hypothetical protein